MKVGQKLRAARPARFRRCLRHSWKNWDLGRWIAEWCMAKIHSWNASPQKLEHPKNVRKKWGVSWPFLIHILVSLVQLHGLQKRWPVVAPGSPISRHSERWMIRFVPKLDHQNNLIPSISVLMPQTPLFFAHAKRGNDPRTQPKMWVMWTGANQVRGVPHFVIRTENSRTASWEKKQLECRSLDVNHPSTPSTG